MSVYADIANQFKKRIQLGVLPPNSKLPREPELAESLSVTRKTLRNALSILESEKLITRKKRLGTYVATDADKIVRAKFNVCALGDFNAAEGASLFLGGGFGEINAIPSNIAVRRLLADGVDVKFVSSRGLDAIPEGMDGFIVIDALHSSSVLKMLADRATPHISFGTHLNYSGVNTVMADDAEAVERCVRKLVDAGHRRIAFHGGALKKEEINSGIRRRTVAFRNICDRLAVEGDEWVYNFDESLEGRPDFNILSERLLSKAPHFTAVVCALGKGALSLLNAGERMNVNIPGDLALICVDSITFDMRPDEIERLRRFPGLFKPRDDVASIGLEALFKWIGNDNFKPTCRKIPFKANDHFNDRNSPKELLQKSVI